MNKHKLHNESGLVSIVVAMLIALLVAIITISFVKLTNREARQTLDRQLSSAAFYAAESGVNDTVAAIISGRAGSLTTGGACNSRVSTLDPKLNSNDFLQYTCVGLTKDLPEVEFGGDSISTNGKSITLKTLGANAAKIRIEWENGTKTNFRPTAEQLVGVNSWSNAPDMLRTVIFGSNPARTFFLYPSAGSGYGTYPYPASEKTDGAIVPGNCEVGNASKGGYYCGVDITGSFPTMAGMKIGMNGIYYTKASGKGTSLRIRAYDASGKQLIFTDVQWQIDVTAKANDVLKRIAVRVPINNTEVFKNNFVVQTTDTLCKVMQVNKTTNYVDIPAAYKSDPACYISPEDGTGYNGF